MNSSDYLELKGEEMNNLDFIVQAMKNLGGSAALTDLYDEYGRITNENLTDGQKAGIRKILETHSSDSTSYNGKDDLFYSVEGIRKGIWGLREMSNVNNSINIQTNYIGIMNNLRKIFGRDTDGFVVPEVYFSDEEPKRVTYGKLDRDTVENKLEKLGQAYSERHPEEEYNGIIYQLTNLEARWNLPRYMLPNLENPLPDWGKELLQEVKKILEEEKYVFTIEAEYISAQNIIKVYARAFDDYDNDAWRSAEIRKTIAHELFHAFHHYAAPRTYEQGSYKSEVVCEALADFYSYVLCYDSAAATEDCIDFSKSKGVADNRHRFWEEFIFTRLPYPNAIFFMFINGMICDYTQYANESIERLKNVFYWSKVNMNQAYTILVPEAFRKRGRKASTKRKNMDEETERRGMIIDSGFDNNSLMETWDIIKKIIKDERISSLEELQCCIPSDILKIVRGRFITFESGEILAAYPQWEIVNNERFRSFIRDRGYVLHQNKTDNSSPSIINHEPEYLDNQYVQFHYQSSGGFCVSNPIHRHIEINRRTCEVESYTVSERNGRENYTKILASKALIDAFFEELQRANWDNNFYTLGIDIPMWTVELSTAGDKSVKSITGSHKRGPQNGRTIQSYLEKLLEGTGTSENVFGLE